MGVSVGAIRIRCLFPMTNIKVKYKKLHLNSLETVLPFGKYRGLTVGDLLLYEQADYLDWMISKHIITCTPEIQEKIDAQKYSSRWGDEFYRDWVGDPPY